MLLCFLLLIHPACLVLLCITVHCINMPNCVRFYLWMLAEPLQVKWYVIEQVVWVLIDQLLQGGVATGHTDVPHGGQRCLADEQRLLPSFLHYGVQRCHQQGTKVTPQGLSEAGNALQLDTQLPDVAVELVDCGCGRRGWRGARWRRNDLKTVCISAAGITVGYGQESGWAEQLQKRQKTNWVIRMHHTVFPLQFNSVWLYRHKKVNTV